MMFFLHANRGNLMPVSLLASDRQADPPAVYLLVFHHNVPSALLLTAA
jgi:hypothetical protein